VCSFILSSFSKNLHSPVQNCSLFILPLTPFEYSIYVKNTTEFCSPNHLTRRSTSVQPKLGFSTPLLISRFPPYNPNLHHKMAYFEEIQSAMRYLRLVRQNMESNENTTQTPNRPPQQNDSDTSFEAAKSSIFSTARSRTSSRAASTTNSDVFLDVIIEDSAPCGNLPALIFWGQLSSSHEGSRGSDSWTSLQKLSLGFKDVYRELNLTACSVSKVMHEFEEVRDAMDVILNFAE